MTTQSLLLWIVLGTALQLALWLGIGFWHHWKEFRALKREEAEAQPHSMTVTPPADTRSMPLAWADFRSFRVESKQLEDAAQSICSFYLVPVDGKPLANFLPGQFLTFRLDVPTTAGNHVQIVRCYSLSDAPRSDYYRVSIKRVPAPLASEFPLGRSSNYFHDQVVVGSTLQVRAPSGHFYLERGDFPVVLIGGGVGITPMLSMLNWCLAEQPEREIWLFYGVRNSREPVMKSNLDALAASHANFHLHMCFSDPLPEDQLGQDYQHRGRIDVNLFRTHLPLKPYHFYICGPTPMMQSLVTGLEDWGVPESRIHFEAFGPASIKRKPTSLPPTVATEASNILVNFSKSGKQLVWQSSAGSLLEFAEANGINVDSGCRAGGCGTCQTTIRSGEVSYQQLPDFAPEPGTCLLCVCKPKSNVTLER